MKTRTINLVRITGVVVVVALMTLVSIPPAQARSCACCVDPGEWYEKSREVDDFEFEIINNLKIYRVARIYATDASPENIKGISGPSEDSFVENYTVSVSRTGLRWTLAFKKRHGERGALVFTLPKTAVSFGADLKVNVRREARDPGAIYKELRFKGPVWGTGFFRGGNAQGTKFTLVLQGYGNNCPSDGDFRNWTLAVSGPRASYRFYGAFVVPARLLNVR